MLKLKQPEYKYGIDSILLTLYFIPKVDKNLFKQHLYSAPYKLKCEGRYHVIITHYWNVNHLVSNNTF